ncbi:MAG TPA: M28 family peptidase [Lysobacter sp.]|nr:M28 family peptidase [Lysobacter sp.]
MPHKTPSAGAGLPATGTRAGGSRLASSVLLALFVLVAGLSLRGSAPPAPAGFDAPANVFSAARAKTVLVRLLGDQSPHPTGSAANAAVRDRIVAEFGQLGIPVEVQRRFACGGSTCATVDNVVARIAGKDPAQAVLLSAHYDSVAAGPGASDDGAGVAAIIEVARALLAGPPLPRDVWLLANDGEELGLIGAEAFAREPEFFRIATAINLEARGTGGASLLIETQPGNAALMAAIRHLLPRPSGSSLDYEIYQTLPNDTDFTVYRREGLAGTNFAWARGAARYHTPLDDIAHLDPGSLQQHGDNALAMARAFAAAPASLQATHDAVFFGVLGTVMGGWPSTWNPALLVLGLLAWLTLAWRLARTGALKITVLAGAALTVLAGMALLGGFGWAMHAVLGWLGAMPAAWTAQGGVLAAAFVLSALPIAIVLGRWGRRRFGDAALAIASLLPFALIAVFVVKAMPGASHLGLLPLLAGAVCGHLWPKRPVVWAGIAALVAAGLWFPYAADSYSAIGHPGLPAATVLTGLILLPLLPALNASGRPTGRALGIAAAAGVLVLAVLSLVRPAFDADVPRPMNLMYVGADTGTGADARLFAQPNATLPPGFLREAGFGAAAERIAPWLGRGFPGVRGPALAPPVLQVEQDVLVDGERRISIRLHSQRGADEAGLLLPGGIDVAGIRVQGQPLAPSRWHKQPVTWRKVALVGLPQDGARFEFRATPGQAVTVYGYDRSHGIPDALADKVRARDAIAMSSGGGDATLSWVSLELPELTAP